MKRNLKPLPEQAVLSAAVVTPAAVQQAALKWRRYAPAKSKSLLEARRARVSSTSPTN